MKQFPRQAPHLINRPDELQALAAVLESFPLIAVDTESNSLFAYQEQVCLIQFSTPKADYLVDSMALQDLSLLAPLFADPQIEKVFHAAEYDVLCMRRDFQFEFNNLFDTMIAARILGRKAVGLGSLLAEEFEVQADKRFQRANWGQRPLPQDLLKYASTDTHYLLALRKLLKKELQNTERWPLAQEDFRRVSQIGLNGNPLQKTIGFWRVRGVRDLKPRQQAVLKALWEYREQVAKRINRPLFKVLGDKTLVAIAKSQPKSITSLAENPGMSPRQIQRHGKGLLQAVVRGLQNPLPKPPMKKNRFGEDFKDRIESLRRWRKKRAQKLDVESDVVLPRDLMLVLAKQNPQELSAVQQILRDLPWRREKFSAEILQILDQS